MPRPDAAVRLGMRDAEPAVVAPAPGGTPCGKRPSRSRCATSSRRRSARRALAIALRMRCCSSESEVHARSSIQRRRSRRSGRRPGRSGHRSPRRCSRPARSTSTLCSPRRGAGPRRVSGVSRPRHRHAASSAPGPPVGCSLGREEIRSRRGADRRARSSGRASASSARRPPRAAPSIRRCCAASKIRASSP